MPQTMGSDRAMGISTPGSNPEIHASLRRMEFDLSRTSQRETYNLLIGLVTPRPIALITSMDRESRVNAAPFSAYNYLGTDPAIVAIGVGNRPAPGVIGKDTAQNSATPANS